MRHRNAHGYARSKLRGRPRNPNVESLDQRDVILRDFDALLARVLAIDDEAERAAVFDEMWTRLETADPADDEDDRD
jgi:hypothetical protein